MAQTLLFFDLDGTLMINPFGRVVFPIISQAIADASQETPESIFKAIVAEHDWRLDHPLPNRPLTMDWEDIIQAVAARYGVKVELSVEELVKTHAAPPFTSVLDHAPEVLARLRDGHRRLIVASMGLAKYQVPVLKGLGLYDFFDDFLMPDTTGYLKTDREFYGDYLQQPALRIHIGDRYDHDCYFPKQFGGLSVMRLPLPELADYSPFERPQQLDQVLESISGKLSDMPTLPDAVVTDLSELPHVIEQLTARYS